MFCVADILLSDHLLLKQSFELSQAKLVSGIVFVPSGFFVIWSGLWTVPSYLARWSSTLCSAVWHYSTMV